MAARLPPRAMRVAISRPARARSRQQKAGDVHATDQKHHRTAAQVSNSSLRHLRGGSALKGDDRCSMVVSSKQCACPQCGAERLLMAARPRRSRFHARDYS